MRISIAMCTFDGELYLKEQLNSITAQGRLPDEIIICDDKSSDNTKGIIEAFISEANFPIKFYANVRRLGTRKNFEKAISLCSGDIVALSDQDDVWHPDKLACIEEVFLSNTSVGAVFSDAKIVNECLCPLNYSLWQCCHFSHKERQLISQDKSFELLLVRNFITGATMAFRSSYIKLVLPIPNNIRLWHDGWIALMIAAVASVAYIEKPLIQYRQHPSQQLGARLSSGMIKRMLEEGSLESWNEERWRTSPSDEKLLRSVVTRRLKRMKLCSPKGFA